MVQGGHHVDGPARPLAAEPFEGVQVGAVPGDGSGASSSPRCAPAPIRLEGAEAARSALHYVAPVGEKDEYVSRALRNVEPYLRSTITA